MSKRIYAWTFHECRDLTFELTYASCLSKVFKGLEDRDSLVFLSLIFPLAARPNCAHQQIPHTTNAYLTCQGYLPWEGNQINTIDANHTYWPMYTSNLWLEGEKKKDGGKGMIEEGKKEGREGGEDEENAPNCTNSDVLFFSETQRATAMFFQFTQDFFFPKAISYQSLNNRLSPEGALGPQLGPAAEVSEKTCLANGGPFRKEEERTLLSALTHGFVLNRAFLPTPDAHSQRNTTALHSSRDLPSHQDPTVHRKAEGQDHSWGKLKQRWPPPITPSLFSHPN